MTGIRSSEMAQETMSWLLEHLQTTCTELFEGTPHIHKFQVHLINSDFSIGAPIRQEALHALITSKYHLPCLYETTVYQGVKTKYFFNDTPYVHPTHASSPRELRPLADSPVTPEREGRCSCPTLCKGDGTGSGLNQCKKITISPFQTGQVIIQASGLPDGSIRHIHQAMKFIQSVFVHHSSEVIRRRYLLSSLVPIPAEVASASSAWIPHPSLRRTTTVPISKIIDRPD